MLGFAPWMTLMLLPQVIARSVVALFTVLSESARTVVEKGEAPDDYDDRYSEEVITFLTTNSQS